MTLRLGLSPRRCSNNSRSGSQSPTCSFTARRDRPLCSTCSSLWMFGTELERTWGTRFFTKYYFVTGIGAAAISLLLVWWIDDLLLGDDRRVRRDLRTCCSPTRCTSRIGTIYLYFMFPVRAKYFVMIIGAHRASSRSAQPGGGVAHTAHLGGLVVGYLYLKGLKCAAAGRAEVPVAAVEDEPRPQPVRRLHRRPLDRRRLEERLEEAHSLS